ncbi:uncharacterized protein [Montipora capricornis]|uniref:uncharacterized protein n=1 Tax=Montipora capricornis TaxID=246305 RepID=UPI0035F1C0BC
MVRSRPALNLSRATAKKEDLSKLSSEVLQLRLQALNLPITGSKAQLAARLATALFGNPSTAVARGKKPSPTAKKATSGRRRSSSKAVRARATSNNPVQTAPNTFAPAHVRDIEDSAQSDEDSSSSIGELFDHPATPVENPDGSTPLSLAQRAAIEEIVAETVSNAFEAFRTPARPESSPQAVLRPRTPGMASPLGLSRPVDRNLEDRILRGEYVDLALLLPESLNEPQTPELQLRLDDSALGPMGSPVTMVRKRRPTIDSFQKWLDAYTAFMLVLVAAYPRRALELIKYQQIISRAVTKFKGMAWYSYDQQFRRRAAYNLSISWDTVDLELWTVTFSGLAKPHCSVCSSPYHTQDDCPSADPNRKPRRVQSTVCFDFNKPSGCRRRNCSYPHVCRRCFASNHAATSCPQQPSGSPSPSRSSSASERSKK